MTETWLGEVRDAEIPKEKSPVRDRIARRSRVVLAEGDVVGTDLVYREDIWTRDAGICQICLYAIDRTVGRRGPLAYEVDHIDPLGDHVADNLRAVHAFCNGSKSADGHDPEPVVARAVLSRALAEPAAAKFRTTDIPFELARSGRLFPRLLAVLRRQTYALAARAEYLEHVQHWAEQLPIEVERYKAWAIEGQHATQIQ